MMKQYSTQRRSSLVHLLSVVLVTIACCFVKDGFAFSPSSKPSSLSRRAAGTSRSRNTVSSPSSSSSSSATVVIENKSHMDSVSTAGDEKNFRSYSTVIRSASAPTIEAPTRERVDRTTRRSGGGTGRRYDSDADDDDDDDDLYNNNNDDDDSMEYLMDPSALRGNDDPFHILLMGSTFEKPKITVSYVCSTLEYVLGMPVVDAFELAQFAKDNGMSCLGTWKRSECLSLGKKLQVRDIVCRIVPYCEGGQRGWQAKDSSFSSSSSSSSD